MHFLWFRNVEGSSGTTKIAATAVLASMATLSAVEIYRSYRLRQKRLDLERVAAANGPNRDTLREVLGTTIDSIIGHSEPSPSGVLAYDEALIREQLSRNYSFFGDDSMKKVRNGRVIIVGCGGVGSWAAVMLVRS